MEFINVGKKPGGLLGETYETINNLISEILEEIKKQEPINSISINEDKNTKYGKIKSYIGHESGFFICELFDSFNYRNGIFISSRNPTKILQEHIQSAKLMSKIEVNNGGYIFSGKDQSKQVLIFECPNDSEENVKVKFKIIIPNNRGDDWDVLYEIRKCDSTILMQGDKKLRDRMNKKILDKLLHELQTLDASRINIYGSSSNKHLSYSGVSH